MSTITKVHYANQLSLMRARETITTEDVKSVFNMEVSFYDGPLCRSPDFFEGSVKIAKIRAKNEFVEPIVSELSHKTLEKIENQYVFIGITNLPLDVTQTSFVWIPLSNVVFVFKGQPFEIIERPHWLKHKNNDVIDCCIGEFTYQRGTGYNELKNTKHKILQENHLRRKYKVYRHCIKAIEDILDIQILWDNSNMVNDFLLERMHKTFEPMYLLRHKPEKISINIHRRASDLHKIEVNDRCSE